jgi:hypothetical protein
MPNINPSRDLYVWSQHPTANYSLNPFLSLTNSMLTGVRNIILMFDLTSFIGQTVAVADLWMECTGFGVTGKTYELRRLNQVFTEPEATWNEYRTGFVWPGGGGGYGDTVADGQVIGALPTATGPFKFGDVAEIANYALLNQFGFLWLHISGSLVDPSSWRYDSKEAATPPYLELTIAAPGIFRDSRMLNASNQDAQLLEASNQDALMYTQDQGVYLLQGANQDVRALVASQQAAYMLAGA